MAHERLPEEAERLVRRAALRRDALGFLQERRDEPLMDLAEQVLLATDVVVEPAARQASGRHEVADGCAVVPALGEDVSGNVDDLTSALLPPLLVGWAA